jgi:hypothetical protein
MLPERSREAALLGLQRTAGNAAVTHLIESSFAHPLFLQRYEAGEHSQFGARKGKKERRLTINKITLTYGEMIAMGDFFESPDALKDFANKQPDKFKALLEQVRKEKQFFTDAKSLPEAERHKVPDKVWGDILKDQPAGQQYLDMAGKNTSHFAPGPSPTHPDVDHKHEWWSYHLKAIELARSGQMEDAFIENAFGDHFLTDAFSAGHMINKDLVMEKARVRMTAMGGHYSNDFTDKVADGLIKNAPKLNDYQIRTTSAAVWKDEGDRGWWDMNASSLSKVLFAAWDDPKTKEKFLSLFARFVHDDLNQLINTAVGGLEVKNASETWKLSGDETLGSSPDTLRIGRMAVYRSQQDILKAKKAGHKKSLDPEKLAEAVWAYTPQPTANGQKEIDNAIDVYTNPDRKETVNKFIDISVANLELSIEELTKLNRLRHKSDAASVSKMVVTDVAGWPAAEKARVVNELLSGWISDKDVDACVKVIESVYEEEIPEDAMRKDLETVQKAIQSSINSMHSNKQKNRVIAATVWDAAKIKVKVPATAH